MEAERPLGRLVRIGRPLVEERECRGERVVERLAQTDGKVGHLAGAQHPSVEAVPHLPGPEGGFVTEEGGQVVLALVVGTGHPPQG